MKSDHALRDLALLVARAGLGASIAAHGAQKMFGAFGGPGLDGASKMMASLGFDPPRRYAQAASLTELTAGALIVCGMFGPIGPALLVSVMTVAVQSVHRKNGYFATNNGFELNTMYALLAMLLATEGYGSISIDAGLGLREKSSPALGWLGLAGGIAGGLLMLAARTKPQSEQKTIRVETGTTEPVNTGP